MKAHREGKLHRFRYSFSMTRAMLLQKVTAKISLAQFMDEHLLQPSASGDVNATARRLR
jgi:hypothetical protein